MRQKLLKRSRARIFVIDYAVQPIPPSHILQHKILNYFHRFSFINRLRTPVVIDLADKTARGKLYHLYT